MPENDDEIRGRFVRVNRVRMAVVSLVGALVFGLAMGWAGLGTGPAFVLLSAVLLMVLPPALLVFIPVTRIKVERLGGAQRR